MYKTFVQLDPTNANGTLMEREWNTNGAPVADHGSLTFWGMPQLVCLFAGACPSGPVSKTCVCVCVCVWITKYGLNTISLPAAGIAIMVKRDVQGARPLCAVRSKFYPQTIKLGTDFSCLEGPVLALKKLGVDFALEFSCERLL